MKKLALLNLSEFGSVLSSRETGRAAADRLQDAAVGGGLVVSFRNVEIATPSFLDELVQRAGQLLRSRQLVLVVACLDAEVRESLELVVKNREMRLAVLRQGKIELLGGSKLLDETLTAAQELGTFKASELAEQLKLKVPNLHKRLGDLLESGAVVKGDEGGDPSRRGQSFVAPQPRDAEPKKLVAV